MPTQAMLVQNYHIIFITVVCWRRLEHLLSDLTPLSFDGLPLKMIHD